MRSLRTLALAGLALAVAATTALADTPKEIAKKEMAALFVDFDAAAAERLIAEDLIQHNPAVPTGRAVLVGLIPKLEETGIVATTHRLISEGNLVVAHNTYDNAEVFGGDHLVAFDIFRIDDGKVAEHWDNLTPVTPPNPSGRSQTDGTTEITDLDKTAENKALVEAFVNTVLKGGQMDRITDFISAETYFQHNSGVADGLDGLRTAIAEMERQGNAMTYSDVHMVVAEGNFVFSFSEGSFAGKHSAFADLFRVEDGKIVEHWDVIAEIPKDAANSNGKF